MRGRAGEEGARAARLSGSFPSSQEDVQRGTAAVLHPVPPARPRNPRLGAESAWSRPCIVACTPFFSLLCLLSVSAKIGPILAKVGEMPTKRMKVETDGGIIKRLSRVQKKGKRGHGNRITG